MRFETRIEVRCAGFFTLDYSRFAVLALIVIAHPAPHSLSHAFFDAVRQQLLDAGWSVQAHDLYAEGFDPVQPVPEHSNFVSSNALVEQHCAELAAADLIAVLHPNWWGQPPAILKGWVDRVFRLDTAYGYPAGASYRDVPVGLLRARAALVINTSNTPPARESSVFGDPLERLWRDCIFGLCGVHSVVRRSYGPVDGSSLVEREGWIEQLRATLRQLTSDIAAGTP